MKLQHQLFRVLRQECRNNSFPSQYRRFHSLSQCPHPRFQRQFPSRITPRPFARLESTTVPSSQPPSLRNSTSQGVETQNATQEPPRADEPAYELTFTCKPCSAQSTHRITKHGYHKGSVLVTCPQCKNRHIISDHLRVRLITLHWPSRLKERDANSSERFSQTKT